MASRILWAGSSITVVTAKPPMPGSASTWARSSASRAGARSRHSPGSAVYLPVATTSASRAPGGGSAAGGMAGQPGIDELLLLLRGHAGHLQRIPVDAE